MHLAQISAAVHLSWLTAHLYKGQVSTGVIAKTQACCELVLQSSTEQRGMHFALSSAALHSCWLTAHLNKGQVFAGVFAKTQACSEPVLQSSTE